MTINAQQKEVEGILLVDKPKGITSHDVVDSIRRKLKTKRVGHAGTLDPMATGLLIILVGKATKASQFLMSMDKEYEGTIRLGQITDSQDADGSILEENPVGDFTREQIVGYMDSFIGDQYQTPPMFSAKKINGVPLYKLARKGEQVEREPRFIRVSSFDLLRWEKPDIDFRVFCTKGTYVRTLAHDLGKRIGCGGHLIALRRTMIDKLHIKQATGLEAIMEMPLPSVHNLFLPVFSVIPSYVLA